MATTADAVPHDGMGVGERERVAGGRRFDWIAVALSTWLVGGVYLDGWAHNHLPELETFFTPWHGVLYSGFLAVFAFLAYTLLTNRRRGHPWRLALPPGYDLSLAGALIFWAAGAGDLVWHQLFGIEVSVEALLSPTHLALALGAVLMVSGPLRAAWRRPGALPRDPAGALPALLALTYTLAILAFMTQFAHPLVNTLAAPESDPAPGTELYAMRADGGGQTRLTDDGQALHLHPAWSPDGGRIAFAAGRDRDHLQIVVMNADGTGPRQLTATAGNNITPAWSPDGRRIVFASDREGQFELYLMNADGSAQTRLTDGPAARMGPAWSRDGRRIAFNLQTRPDHWQVAVMNADGGGQRTLSTVGASEWGPAWSPDGKTIAFTSTRDGHAEVYLMAADGGGQTRLTVSRDWSAYPTWSADGRRIAFTSRREGTAQVYAMNADGSGVVNLSRDAGADHGADLLAWSPDGRAIVYTSRGHPAGAGDPFYTQGLGIAAILLQTGLLMGVVLLVVRRWLPPPGGLTLVFALSSVLIAFMHDQFALIPAALVAGVVADVLVWWLKPSAARPGALRRFAFAVPVVFYGLYYLAQWLTRGIGWTIHLWLGSMVMAGVAGLLLSYLLAPPVIPGEQGRA
ncbi:MAG TPA: LpqB family beta-propeller domain-containing protein [Thermomicrobiales bacterium]|nr:LpqB family beta-propeller domain-containing protein [Thermomicrobiales bacterium]